jgi:hypothetical protein
MIKGLYCNVFMANTSIFSMRLKAETKKRLAKLAEASGRSANGTLENSDIPNWGSRKAELCPACDLSIPPV